MILALFSEDLQKASKDKTENNNLQMKHMIDSKKRKRKEKCQKSK